MPGKAKDAYAAWKEADNAARAAEQTLDKAWDAHTLHQGKPPSAALIQEVSRARAAANDKLTMALVMLSGARSDKH